MTAHTPPTAPPASDRRPESAFLEAAATSSLSSSFEAGISGVGIVEVDVEGILAFFVFGARIDGLQSIGESFSSQFSRSAHGDGGRNV